MHLTVTTVWLSSGAMLCGSHRFINAGPLVCLSASTGTVLWEGAPSESWYSPALGPPGVVFTTVSSGALTALDPSGLELWSVPAPGQALGPLVGPPGSDLVVLAGDSTLMALSATNGSLLWQYRLDNSASSNVALTPDGTHVVVGASSEIVAVDVYTGALQWTAHSNNAEELPVNVAFDDVGHVFVLWISNDASEGEVQCINGSTGYVQWTLSMDNQVPFTLSVGAGGLLYLGSESGISAVDGATGVSVWSVSAAVSGLVLAADDVVLFASASTGSVQLSTLDGVTGTQLWTQSIDIPIGPPPFEDGYAFYMIMGPGAEVILVAQSQVFVIAGMRLQHPDCRPLAHEPERPTRQRYWRAADTTGKLNPLTVAGPYNPSPSPTPSPSPSPSPGQPSLQPWGQLGHDAQHTGRSPFAVPSSASALTTVWYSPLDLESSSPAVLDSNGNLWVNDLLSPALGCLLSAEVFPLLMASHVSV
jgi:outer membrane protein assembly factor BamB